MIKTRINEKEKSEFESLRNQTSKKESEKALMILPNFHPFALKTTSNY